MEQSGVAQKQSWKYGNKQHWPPNLISCQTLPNSAMTLLLLTRLLSVGNRTSCTTSPWVDVSPLYGGGRFAAEENWGTNRKINLGTSMQRTNRDNQPRQKKPPTTIHPLINRPLKEMRSECSQRCASPRLVNKRGFAVVGEKAKNFDGCETEPTISAHFESPDCPSSFWFAGALAREGSRLWPKHRWRSRCLGVAH